MDKIEYRYYKHKNRLIKKKIIISKCKKCSINEIKLYKGHTGLCRSCSKKGRPYEGVYKRIGSNSKWNNNLLYDEFLRFTKIKNCHYCDTFIKWEKYTSDNSELKSRATNLDRIDPFKDYSTSNCVVCCWDCNQIKRNLVCYEDFIEIGKILKNRKYNSKFDKFELTKNPLDEKYWKY